ncbi:type I toxin-antitoxin system Hok family toxin [Klebsiella pneumoniae]|uniref:type I toxin-antitoxin system Hok family toxin n=1 Tax=Klebsiella pneumoniae TaxID=573 RepID=UPI003CCA75C7
MISLSPPTICNSAIVCLTLLAFTYLTRKSLCEIRYRDTTREVAAFMAYESAK